MSNQHVDSSRGAAIRQARVRRVRSIRRWVAAGAVSLFVAVWLLIAVVMVTGHDPALARAKATTTAASSAGTASTSTAGTSSGSSSSSSGGGLRSVSTSQS